MAKYRKKPVVIEAVQWNGANHLICKTFMKGSGAYISQERSQIGEIVIPTLEGEMLASQGDWIIKGVNGEFYPCKPDIFDKTYTEEVDNFIGRIVNEKTELDGRTGKLGAFVNTEKFHSLETAMQTLMAEQYDVMKRYSVILSKRLELLSPESSHIESVLKHSIQFYYPERISTVQDCELAVAETKKKAIEVYKNTCSFIPDGCCMIKKEEPSGSYKEVVVLIGWT